MVFETLNFYPQLKRRAVQEEFIYNLLIYFPNKLFYKSATLSLLYSTKHIEAMSVICVVMSGKFTLWFVSLYDNF
jgi:hypothetical protein